MTDFDTLVTGLRTGGKHQDAHRKAAVELLIWHETWVRRSSFVRDVIGKSTDGRYVRWSDASDYADTAPRCSSSELNVLRLAIALATDEFGLSGMGHAHADAIVTAFKTALGVS